MTKHTLTTCLSAQPTLVKDIHPGIGASVYLGLAQSTVVGNTLYFTADDDVHGTELWKSDGTEAGTVMVRDIFQGTTNDGPQDLYMEYKNQLYFTAYQTALGTELWRTDDGPDGAVLVKDACPGDCSGAQYFQPLPMAVYQDKLYFRSLTAAEGQELWATDGDSASTTLVKDIDTGGSDSNPYLLTVFQNKLYFVCDSANWGRELWVTDGTEAGTRPVKNINPTLSFSAGDSEIDGLVVGTDALYFWAKNNNATGKELWKSDGTEAGTVLVKDIQPGSGNGASSKPLDNSAWIGNQLIFSANDGTSGEELWVTDGTEAGTVLVADINPGAANSNIQIFAAINGSVLFKANDGTNGYELWTTDGTAVGTKLLKDIGPGAADGLRFSTVPFTVFQNKLIFTANDGIAGREIWISDGTVDGTMLLSDVDPGAAESNPSNYHVIGNTLFFFAQNNAKGRELWTYDLASVGTHTADQLLDFDLYPTASADGFFTIQTAATSAAENLQVAVFDALGRQRATQSLNTGVQQLNLSALPVGAYLVRITGTETRQSGVERVFIMR